MKSVFRFLALGLLATIFGVGSVTTVSAQDAQAEKTALYTKYTENYDKDLAKRKIAVEAAKQYIEKYGANKEDEEQVNYFKTALPALEKSIADEEGATAKKGLYDRFNTAAKAKNWDEVYAGGKAVLAQEKDPATALDVTLLLGSIGLDESIKNNDKHNADTVKYAQEAIQKLEAGATSKNFGIYDYVYKNDKFPDGKNNALGWMNFTIGYIKYFRDKNEKEALPYLYKTTQYTSANKNKPAVYDAIGQYYLKETIRLEEERQTKLKAANNADNDETKAIYAMQKGYADRVIDAFARAYSVAGTDPKQKAYKDDLYQRLKTTYVFRNNGKDTGIDAYIASVKAKPMPNPATEVTPVVETPAATSAPTTDGGTGSSATPAATPAANQNATKPAATKPATKPTASNTTKP